MRISDAERQRAIDELRRHCGAGRLDVDEYASRIEQALAATTLAELDTLLVDLPMLRIADPTGATANGSARQLGPGRLRIGEPAGDSYSIRGRALTNRLVASAAVILSVVVVLLVVVLASATSWAWAVLLLVVGWVIGLVQGRIGHVGSSRRRRD